MTEEKNKNYEYNKKKLLTNATLIIQHVQCEDVMDSLYSNIDSFTTDDYLHLLYLPTNLSKMRKLLDILRNCKSDDVYFWFNKALIDVDTIGCDEVARIIEKTEVVEENLGYDKKEIFKNEVLGVSNYIREIGNQNEIPNKLPFNKDYSSSANLAGESLNKFVSFTFKKKNKTDHFKDIPVYVALSLCNFRPEGMSSEYEKYKIAIEKLQNSFQDSENQEIENCIENLLQYEIKGFEPVILIAQEMFTKCNIGIVVTWFRFWRMFFQSTDMGGDQKESLRVFCAYVGFYLYDIPAYQEWAVKGWEEVLEKANEGYGFTKRSWATSKRYMLLLWEIYQSLT